MPRRQLLPTASVLVSIVIAWDAGCGSGTDLRTSVQPEIIDEAVEPNPNSAISAVFSVRPQGARSVRIEISGEPDGLRETRDLVIADEAVRVPLLGLYADTDYEFRAIAVSESGSEAFGDWMSFRTGSLPTSIATFEVTAFADTRPGLTLLAARREAAGPPHPAVIIDGAGRVVWYRETSSSLVDLQLQPNGHLTAAVQVSAPAPYAAGTYQEWDSLGNVVREWTAIGHDVTDSHELRLLANGDGLLFGYDTRLLDLTRLGGPPDATVIGDVLQRRGADGTVLFEWNAFEHYRLEDADDFVWQGPAAAGYDFTHCNAIETLPNGDYLISTRHLSEVTRIDGRTGDVRWRMGKGKGNQFTFVNDPKGGFWNMHAVRRLPNGHLILIDNGNGHVPPSSRAVEYEIDEEAKTATLVWSFEPGIVSCCMGFAQRLPNGNTLVTLGQDNRVFEVSPTSDVLWQVELAASGHWTFDTYRAMRIPSLDDLQ